MISVKTEREIELMSEAGRIAGCILAALERCLEPGISTYELDQEAVRIMKKFRVKSSFKGFRGYPASICVSINDVVVHGIPSSKVRVAGGDIVSIDLGVIYRGYHSDMAATFPVGKITKEAERLLRVTEEARELGIAQAVDGHRVSDISKAVQRYVESQGYSVIRSLTGHGIGKSMHEDPPVPNFYDGEPGPVLKKGMTLAIEPMVSVGEHQVKIDLDGWTVRTVDGSLSAHFEHTVAVGENEPLVLTRAEEYAFGPSEGAPSGR